MKAHKTESCTGEALPSFSNYHVGLHQSHLSPSSSLWAWGGSWGGKLTDQTPCPLTSIGETRWDGGLSQDWAVLLLPEHLKVWGLSKMAPGFFFPQQIHRWPAFFIFSCRPSFFISFALSVATQVKTKLVSNGLVRCTAAQSVHMWRIN